ncbi:protein enabled homolog isoform X1 [Scylla paramamosain]|uniref:protein enabled homolog isoform X1 n=2 Tax=Scylla paramamosain TaxID=85552 RepID=UPI003082E703
MTTKNENHLSDTPHDDTQGSSQSSASSSATEGRINQTPLAASAGRRPAHTMDTASSIHKRPRLEISKGNDEASSEEGDGVKVQMSFTYIPVDDNTKLYSKPPMEDPEDERRRRNAVTAWRNRVRKKRQYEELQTTVNTLEEANKKLHDANQQLEEDLRALGEEMGREHSILTQLQSEKCSLQILIQTQQEKLTFIREHLKLINSCSEEDSPVQKFLTALLNNMNSSSPIPFAPPSLAAASLPHDSSHMPTLSPPTTSPPCTTSPRLTTSPLHVIMPLHAQIPRSTTASHYPRNNIDSPAHEAE